MKIWKRSSVSAFTSRGSSPLIASSTIELKTIGRLDVARGDLVDRARRRRLVGRVDERDRLPLEIEILEFGQQALPNISAVIPCDRR